MKKCFGCKFKKPLFLFYKNRMKYQLKSDFGRTVECRMCTTKRFVRQKGKVVKYDFNIKKFQVTESRVTIWTIIKEYFRL